MSKSEIEFTDRYKALGIPYPDPKTMCDGQCEGTGVYPQKHPLFGGAVTGDVLTAEEARRWFEAHNAPDAHKELACDGWHFITCPDCEGTGLKKWAQ